MSKLGDLLKSQVPTANPAKAANPDGDGDGDGNAISNSSNFSGIDSGKNTLTNDLRARIRHMAKRWHYSDDDLAEALAAAESDPGGWLAWTVSDEEHFGKYALPADSVAADAHFREIT